MTQTPTQTPAQTPTQTPTQTPAQTPPQGDWWELGAPPPPPALIRQNAFDINVLNNVARRLEFDDDGDENDGGFPLPLNGGYGER